jgi:hypothetical protein
MSKMYFLPFRPSFTSAGVIVPGARHWFTLEGTNTPSAPYEDVGLTTRHTNPLVASGIGYLPPVYLDPAISYRVRIFLPGEEDEDLAVGTPLEEYDPYVPALSNADVLSALAAAGGSSLVNLRPANVAGNGTTDDRAALATADAAAAVDLPVGDYLVSSSVAFTRRMTFRPGARLIIPNGVTVTFSGGISAPTDQIFVCSGMGNVGFSANKVDEVYPEWWGCTVNDATADCLPALTAAVAAHPNVRLQLADYYASDTFMVPQSHRKVRGKGIHWGGIAGRMTRLIIKNAASYGVILGPTSPPLTGGGAVDINALNLDMLFEDIEVTRTVAPSIASAPIGVLVSYCQDAVVRRTKAQDHMIGFATVGSINTRFDDVRSIRVTAGSGGGTDSSIAYRYITGTPALTTINGNASCWLDRAVAYCNPAIPNSEGLRLDANFCDTFVGELETSGVRTPVRIIGDADTHDDSNPSLRTNSNVRIDKLVLDQFGTAGVRIEKLNKYGHVRIGDIYAGPSVGATAAIHVTDCKGSITVEAGELAMVASNVIPALLATNSKNIQMLEGLSIIEAGGHMLDLTDVSDSRFTCSFRNEFVSADQAILGNGTCVANYYAPKVSGGAGKVPIAVSLLGTAHARSTVDVSAINSAVSSTNKLYYNAGGITAAGVFGTTNLAQGNFA